MRLADLSEREVGSRLAGAGVALDFGLVRARVVSNTSNLPRMIQRVYGGFPVIDAEGFFDLTVRLNTPGLLRRFIRPIVEFQVETQAPFPPYPADTPLPLLEWGINYVLSDRRHDHLLLHGGTVARGRNAVVMPALPGAGKSTLTAALMLRGYRLLSDEFAALNLGSGTLTPCVRPIGLKNESIEVISRFSEHAVLGPVFPKTPKGRVAHVAPTQQSIDRRSEPADPKLILFPRFLPGASTQLLRVSQGEAFARVSGNSFNYELLGADGFRAAIDLVRSCRIASLVYSDLDSAVATLGEELERGLGAD